jgi:hypothetical protein
MQKVSDVSISSGLSVTYSNVHYSAQKNQIKKLYRTAQSIEREHGNSRNILLSFIAENTHLI